MKRKIAVFLCLVSLYLCALTACSAYGTNADYLRIHIRANSDLDADQEVKLVVRDSVIEYLSPFLCKVKTRKEAENVVLSHVNELQRQIDELLYSCGFFYGCSVRVDTEFFEKRSYGDLTLDAGYYRAVIVDLGTGEGHNWWCVAFPPLCFTLSENYENAQYRSILYDVVKKYLDKEEK